MGANSSSHEQIQEYLNQVTTTAFISATNTCESGTNVEQSMALSCDPHVGASPGTITTWYPENVSCLRCMGLASERWIKYWQTTKDGFDSGLGDGRSWKPYVSEAEALVGKYAPKINFITKAQLVDNLGEPMWDQKTRGMYDEFRDCANSCVACIFDGNLQQAVTQSMVTCMDSMDVLNKMKADIKSKILQDLTKDTDVFASAVEALPLGTRTDTSVTQHIENIVTNKLEQKHVTAMVASIKLEQDMNVVGQQGAVRYAGNTQSSVIDRITSSVRTSRIYNESVATLRVDAAQKVVKDSNTTKRVAATVGNIVRKMGELMGMGVLIFMLIGMAVVFLVIVFLIFALRSGGGLLKKATQGFQQRDYGAIADVAEQSFQQQGYYKSVGIP